MRNLIRSIVVVLGLVASATVFAQAYLGTYSRSERIRSDGRDFTLVQTLKIDRSGRAELTSEYRGDRPRITSGLVQAWGEILERVADSRRIVHAGGWFERKGKIEIRLDNVRGLDCSFTFVADAREVRAEAKDNGIYGRNPMTLRRDSGGNIPDNGRIEGTYRNEFRLRDGNRFQRELQLRRNGEAVMITENLGRNPNVTKEDRRLWGNILLALEYQRRFEHVGTWEMRGDRVTVRLTRVGDRREECTLQFQVDRDGLRSVGIDDDAYGWESFTLRRAR
ncbi:MAG TPA: hypothetical protein PLH94_07605 [Fimbriimonadaceae bacterium]|nr:hypothetical protein [Fimbriimonadaceae bacterium]